MGGIGGGPNVNAQVGREVTQQVVGNQTRTDVGGDQTVTTNKVSTGEVEKVVVQEVPPWVVLLLILGWLLPSPNEIANKLTRWFKR